MFTIQNLLNSTFYYGAVARKYESNIKTAHPEKEGYNLVLKTSISFNKDYKRFETNISVCEQQIGSHFQTFIIFKDFSVKFLKEDCPRFSENKLKEYKDKVLISYDLSSILFNANKQYFKDATLKELGDTAST